MSVAGVAWLVGLVLVFAWVIRWNVFGRPTGVGWSTAVFVGWVLLAWSNILDDAVWMAVGSAAMATVVARDWLRALNEWVEDVVLFEWPRRQIEREREDET